jgi:hypothetical protein
MVMNVCRFEIKANLFKYRTEHSGTVGTEEKQEDPDRPPVPLILVLFRDKAAGTIRDTSVQFSLTFKYIHGFKGLSRLVHLIRGKGHIEG